MMAHQPESIYLMHFSRVTGTPRLAAMLKSQIREFVRIAQESAAQPDVHESIRTAMMEMWLKLLRQQGSTLSPAEVSDWLEGDLELNAQGLVIWMERQRKDRGAPNR